MQACKGAVVALAIAGCAVDPAALPAVRIVSDVGTHAQAASTWSQLGFGVGDEAAAVECPSRWYAAPRTVDCGLTITILVEPDLVEREGTAALAERERRGVRVDSRLTGLALCIAVAHEVGHIVLDTPLHTAGGVMGGADCSLGDVDRALACEAIGACG